MSQVIEIGKDCLTTRDEYEQLHSYNDMPAVEYTDRQMFLWYYHGQLHRNSKNGPAFLNDDTAKYFTNGRLHNDDGPAVIRRFERKYMMEFWTNGKLDKIQEYYPRSFCSTSKLCSLFESYGGIYSIPIDNFYWFALDFFLSPGKKLFEILKTKEGRIPPKIQDIAKIMELFHTEIPEINKNYSEQACALTAKYFYNRYDVFETFRAITDNKFRKEILKEYKSHM